MLNDAISVLNQPSLHLDMIYLVQVLIVATKGNQDLVDNYSINTSYINNHNKLNDKNFPNLPKTD